MLQAQEGQEEADGRLSVSNLFLTSEEKKLVLVSVKQRLTFSVFLFFFRESMTTDFMAFKDRTDLLYLLF